MSNHSDIHRRHFLQSTLLSSSNLTPARNSLETLLSAHAVVQEPISLRCIVDTLRNHSGRIPLELCLSTALTGESNRYSSAGQVIADLKTYLSGYIRNRCACLKNLQELLADPAKAHMLNEALTDAESLRRSKTKLYSQNLELALKLFKSGRNHSCQMIGDKRANTEGAQQNLANRVSLLWSHLKAADQQYFITATERGDLVSQVCAYGPLEFGANQAIQFARELFDIAIDDEDAMRLLSPADYASAVSLRDSHIQLMEIVKSKHGIDSCYLEQLEATLTGWTQFIQSNQDSQEITRDEFVENIPAKLHDAFLRLGVDVETSYLRVLRPNGTWVAEIFESAHSELAQSLDPFIRDLATTTIQELFPGYLQANPRRAQTVDQNLKARSDIAKRRAQKTTEHSTENEYDDLVLPWHDCRGNDYY
jgi:hypothetical protein